jgi:hypothetical protein
MEKLVPMMERLKVKRLFYVSAYGTGDTRADYSWWMKLILLEGILKNPFRDHNRAEHIILKSSLDWMIARPGQLTQGASLGHYQAQERFGRTSLKISRADVAHFLLKEAKHPKWTKKAVGLGY